MATKGTHWLVKRGSPVMSWATTIAIKGNGLSQVGARKGQCLRSSRNLTMPEMLESLKAEGKGVQVEFSHLLESPDVGRICRLEPL